MHDFQLNLIDYFHESSVLIPNSLLVIKFITFERENGFRAGSFCRRLGWWNPVAGRRFHVASLPDVHMAGAIESRALAAHSTDSERIFDGQVALLETFMRIS